MGKSFKDDKSERIRGNISLAINLITIVCFLYDFVPAVFVIFVVFTSSATVIFLNSRNCTPDENKGGIMVLALMVGLISFGYFVTNNDNAKGIESAMEYCYSKGDKYSILCNEIESRLSYSSVVPYGDYSY